MKRKYKYIPLYFDYTRSDDFAAFLSGMANKGWMLVSLGSFMKFERTEPSEEVYDVQVFLQNGDLDYYPNQYTEELSAYCLASGWEMVGAHKKWTVFRKVDPDAPAIFSNGERIRDICSIERKSHVLSLIAYALLLVSHLYIAQTQYYQWQFPWFYAFPILDCIVIIYDIVYLLLLSRWKKEKEKEMAETGNIFCGKGNIKPDFLSFARVAFVAITIVTAVLVIHQIPFTE